jgi:hypothetical protein
MKIDAANILPFSCASTSTGRRARRKELLRTLRASRSSSIIDLSGCPTLNHEDVGLLLECAAQVAGRDTQLLFVAGSVSNRVLFEVTRISSLAPIFNSLQEALAYPQRAARSPIARFNSEEDLSQSQERWSA